MTATSASYSRPIPLMAIVLVALAVHGPLLLMQLPAGSFDTNFHIFLASHYAHHWFNPWNEKWFAGFSQTTYPPLTHQWIALVSNIAGLKMAYMIVQLVAVLLLPVGVFRFARLWVDDRAASYAALGTVFLGALAFLVYQAGQLATVSSAALYLNALPYFFEWSTQGSGRSLVKGLAVGLAAAAAHHVTLIFGTVLFAGPVLWLACLDARDGRTRGSVGSVVGRAIAFAVLIAIGVGIVLLPYWVTLIQHPIHQIPIPHDSRNNYLLNSTTAINYFFIPYGALILALPFILWRGASVRRLRPLLFGFWVTAIFGIGGTTPLPRWILGRAFEILTFERFTFWATLMAMPIVGLLAIELLDRFRAKAAVGLALAAVITIGSALAWLTSNPYRPTGSANVEPVIAFLNRDGHDSYRYLTLGFGSELAKVSTYTDASSVDGDYNSARLLPEMTHYGSAQLTNAKFYGSAGMESLRAMLEHANRYGLKYIFVHDSYYEPLLTFVGWRKTEIFDNGEISAWSKDDVPPAHRIQSDAIPPAWMGFLWGTLPIGVSILAMFLVIFLPEKYRMRKVVESATPIQQHEGHYVA
ncbi:MAG TPA: 6-pyruvoyl-tetrahydropterin synthase-related protein [Candidatus Sulfotelmatobacter sp.]|nr:6-pyruvoyl-tetrahydropterin synthase-related protein [Candidatus Sulfotelmatobacter sp.]